MFDYIPAVKSIISGEMSVLFVLIFARNID